jgi:hypothetical protein
MENCNEDKLNKQKGYLRKEIYEGENDTYFKVIDLECGTGKSRTTMEILANNCDENIHKYLYVVERNSDAIQCAKRINLLANKTVAIAVNTDNCDRKEFNKIKGQLNTYRVVIISHEKYKALVIDKINRKYFTDARDTLIIDEFLDMSKGNELVLNIDYLHGLETLLLHRALRKEFADCTSEVEDYLLAEKPMQSFFNSKVTLNVTSKKINHLKKLINTNLTQDYLTNVGYTKTQLLREIDNIKQFYNQTCIVEGDIMYATNRRYQYWLLNNNIILDASGKLNKSYELNDIFKLQHQTPVLDHKQWTFITMNTNTCNSAKSKAIDFYETVDKVTKTLGIDNTLVVGNKADEISIKSNYKNHFGNLTGSNEYKDLSNCVIIHNPNLPYRQYVLQYLYHSNKKFDNRNKWCGKRCGSGNNQVYRFYEDKFEEFRQCVNANELYQAIKRVNRNMELNSKIFIFNNDSEMLDRVLKMFRGEYKTKEYDNKIEFEKTKKEEYDESRKENRQAMKFIKLCQDIRKLKYTELQATKKNRKHEDIIREGIYNKDALREFMQIKDKSNFTNKVLNDADVIAYLNKHNIIVNTRTLDFTQYTA